MQPANFSLYSISIKHRLPLLIGILLLSIITASTWASYQGVKEAAVKAGSERLQNLTEQLANLSQQSSTTLLARTYSTANEPAIRSFLENPSPNTRLAAASILDQFSQSKEPASLQVDLWDSSRHLLLTEPEGASALPFDLETEFAQSFQTPFKSAGALRLLGDAIVAPTVAAVNGDGGAPIGYLVRWRRVSASPQPTQLRDLLGSEATFYFGNTAGDVWTDLVKPVPKPPADLRLTLSMTHYIRNGESVMAMGRPINGTPYFLIVEFPHRAVLGQAGHFLRRVLFIDAVLLAIGLLAAFTLSRSITRPLNLLTSAASELSQGSYSRLVRVRGNDELAALGKTFNAMVVRLRASQEELEKKIQQLRLAQKSASELAAIVESSHDAIIGKTLGGTVTSWNKGAEELYGYTAEEMLDQSIRVLFPPDHHDEVDLILESLRRGECIDHFETDRITKDGKRVAVSLSVSPIRDESGDINGSSTIARDITARKQTEAALVKTNQRLEGALAGVQTKTEELASMTQQLWQASKLATLGELAASVAHELNNPLAIISLRLEALAMELSDDAKTSHAVDTVSDEVERMGRLVGSLLEFSRRGHQQISTVDVSEEIKKSVELIEYYLRSHKVVVIEDFEPDLPTIQADRQQLRQVFLNLLTNASDAMSGGGNLIARTRRVRLRNGGRGVSIEFADGGSGISQIDLGKIWEPFFTTKMEGKGTGLGLAICRRLIEEHHGEISIESRLGEGTTVSVYLPATTGDEELNDREHLNREVAPEVISLGAR